MKTGTKIKDSEGNIFTITEIVKATDVLHYDAITLKGEAGEKEIASDDLKFYTVIE